MANRFSLRIMKFFVDLLYYALPVIGWICKAAFWILVAAVFILVFVMLL